MLSEEPLDNNNQGGTEGTTTITEESAGGAGAAAAAPASAPSGSAPGASPPSAAISKLQTYYDLLGVPLNATAAQIQSAHKKMTMVYHPERNPNDEGAAAKLVAINEAFQTLNDASKRQAYDVSINNYARLNADGTQSVSSLGGLSRAIGSFADRLVSTIPLFTSELPEDMMTVAKEICTKTGFNSPGPMTYVADSKNPNKLLASVSYSDLAWGWNVECKVDRMTCQYYRLTVTEAQADVGFLLQCRSARADKFKLFVFNGADGAMMYCSDSRKSRDKTTSHVLMFFNTTFDVYDSVESANTSTTSIGATKAVPNPTSMNAAAYSVQRKGNHTVSTTHNQINVAVDTPPVFSRVESFEPCRKRITGPGTYLIAIFGENYMQRSHCSLTAVPCKNTSTELPLMAEHDQAIMAMRKSLPTLLEKYIKAKAEYDAVLFEIGRDSDRLETLLQTRDLAYRGFVVECQQDYNPAAAEVAAAAASASSAASGGTGSGSEGEEGGEQGVRAAGAGDEAPASAGTPPALRGVRLRRDSFQDVAAAATAAANAAASQATAAAAGASGWVSSKITAGASSLGKFRSSFTAGAPGGANAATASTGTPTEGHPAAEVNPGTPASVSASASAATEAEAEAPAEGQEKADLEDAGAAVAETTPDKESASTAKEDEGSV